MNRILNYFRINRGNKRITYFLLAVIMIFNITYYITFLSNTRGFKVNWYDFIISVFSNYMNMAYFYFVIFILYICNIFSKTSFNKYAFFKFKSKREWYFNNIFSILIHSIIFTTIITINLILEGIFTLSFGNKWSEYSNHIISSNRIVYLYSPKTFSYIMDNMSPLKYLSIEVLFILCFFVVIGILYFNLSMIFNNIGAFVSILIFNCINIGIYICDLPKGLDLYYNTSIITSYERNLDPSIIYSRLLYWFLFIMILIIIGNIMHKYIDFEFGDVY